MITRIRRSIATQRQAIYTLLLAVLYQSLVWLVFYPLVGYTQWAILATSAVLLVAVLGANGAYHLGLKAIGFDLDNLGWAVLVLIVALCVVLLSGVVMRIFDVPVVFFRSRYSFAAIGKVWGLASITEALLFGGVLYTMLRRGMPDRFAWRYVLIIAVFYVLYQIPEHIALGALRTAGFATLPEILSTIASDFALWVICGMIYELGENLWLMAFALASSRYALTPLIVEKPVLAIAFYALLALFAWWLERPDGWANDKPKSVGMGNLRELER